MLIFLMLLCKVVYVLDVFGVLKVAAGEGYNDARAGLYRGMVGN